MQTNTKRFVIDNLITSLVIRGSLILCLPMEMLLINPVVLIAQIFGFALFFQGYRKYVSPTLGGNEAEIADFGERDRSFR